MQQHRQLVCTGQPQLFAQQPVLMRTHLWRAQFRHKKVEADFAHRHQMRIITGCIELLGQLLQFTFAGR